MSPQERYRAPQPLAITNEGFIGEPERDPLEDIYDDSLMTSFWRDMAEYAPAETNIYGRNASLLRITEGVVKGELQMTGTVQDIREVCELFFERQGSINALRGPDAPDRLFKVASRYLETCAADKERLDDESIAYGQLPVYAARLFRDGQLHNVLGHLNPLQRATFGGMLLETSYAYDSNVATQGQQAEALRNTFESWALEVFGTVNGAALSAHTAPEFLQQYKRAAWAAQYDVRFAQISRIEDRDEREDSYKKLLTQQLAEADILLCASAMPTGRSTDGLLYEYFLPVSIRYNALAAGQQDMVGVRRATKREDAPIDGMTHPKRTEEYDRYSFDMLLRYPQHDRRVFLQTKLGQDTTGYDEGVKVYNYHTNVKDIREYMANAVNAMYVTLQGGTPAPDRARVLSAERMRTAPLLPNTID